MWLVALAFDANVCFFVSLLTLQNGEMFNGCLFSLVLGEIRVETKPGRQELRFEEDSDALLGLFSG